MLESKIKSIAKKFLEQSKNKEILIVSHFDTDGITSATIMLQALKKLDKKFSVKIIKSLDMQFINNMPKNKLILFLDLASGSLNHLSNSGLKDIFIIDHHEITQEIPKNINIINPQLHNKQKISSSGLTYLFCKEINSENKEFAKLAILGMIGDTFEKEIDKLNNEILNDGEVLKKRGLLIYPSTRPLNRVLEYSSNPYIPGVSGDMKGVLELLRESQINPHNGRYKSLIELNEDEMSKLVTSVMLRIPKSSHRKEPIIGDIFLIKIFNKLEDARELSAMINACSRLGESETAIQFLMEIPHAKKKVESMHVKYKQHLISGLKVVSEIDKIVLNGGIIINAKNKIKDTIIGTIASILSKSSMYEEGTVIVTMALEESGKRIKVSSRNVGERGRNVREILDRIITQIGEGEVGGHEFAAGCLIPIEKEQEFINALKKDLEIELVKI